MDPMDLHCKIKVQSGSISGRIQYVWIDAKVTRKIDNYQYVVRSTDGDQLFYLPPEEIYVDLYSMKLWLDEQM